MVNNFSKIMSQRSDSELIDIISKGLSDYEPEALAAAKTELEKRNLTDNQVVLAKEELIAEEQIIVNKANTPLGLGWKLLTFFIPGIPNLLFAMTLKAEDYTKKWQDAWRWTFYGAGFYIILIVLAFLLN